MMIKACAVSLFLVSQLASAATYDQVKALYQSGTKPTVDAFMKAGLWGGQALAPDGSQSPICLAVVVSSDPLDNKSPYAVVTHQNCLDLSEGEAASIYQSAAAEKSRFTPLTSSSDPLSKELTFKAIPTESSFGQDYGLRDGHTPAGTPLLLLSGWCADGRSCQGNGMVYAQGEQDEVAYFWQWTSEGM